MGGCLSKCTPRKTKVEVLDQERCSAINSSDKWASRRHDNGDISKQARSTTSKQYWAKINRSKPRVVVSPMHDDGSWTGINVVQDLFESTTNIVATPNLATSVVLSAKFEGEIGTVKPENATSQAFESEEPPKNVDENIEILPSKNEGNLEIVDVESEGEFDVIESSNDDSIEDSCTSTNSEPSEFVDDKNEPEDGVIQENDVDWTKKIAMRSAKGPGVILINVRPISPEENKVEFLVPPVAAGVQGNIPAAPLEKNKEQLIAKQSEMTSLGNNDPIVPIKECPTQVVCVVPSPNEPAKPIAVEDEPNENNGTSKPLTVEKRPEKPKKTRVFDPDDEFLTVYDDLIWNNPKPKKKKEVKRNYHDFAIRDLNPAQKVRASEGRVLDGLLITWPKYIKDKPVDDGRKKKSQYKAAILAWEGEPSQPESDSPNKVSGTTGEDNGTCTEFTKVETLVNTDPVPDDVTDDVSSQDCDHSQATHYSYEPPKVFVRRKTKTQFVEKKFAHNHESESSEDEMEYVFTPENLRRYENRRQERRQRRPRTPHPSYPSNAIQSTKPAVPLKSSMKQSKNSENVCEKETPRNNKCVTFMIPADNGTRAPSTRPNTRQKMRPKTPRPSADDLALRQTKAQKRREEVLRNRANALRKRKMAETENDRKEAETTMANQMRSEMETRMKKHDENRKKRIDNIIAKQTEHIQHVQIVKEDAVTARNLRGEQNQQSASAPDVNYTVDDLVEIDRFFEQVESNNVSNWSPR